MGRIGLVVAPANPNVIYALLDNQEPKPKPKTQKKNKKRRNLPNESVNVIREDPGKENILYLGTDLGIYVSLDKGFRW
ncbi:MAG: hypothetical protein GTO45_13035 [Candidatus Aminicenantes bacterium]|nr:hypothetical protein [Candidatus Aminicenantes bacterium]NIM79705.1 hypothetical protein [Candidatus Aminicenantes bacterium]NIN19035.1 hypothetical protein [Candidatus Aminicenantes bacterium]NIN42937.1 hypothetical protein [Candidatus Aminicenantes bacterium]NIN85674.1 hypothetical protein [Candidatus Aminicenantes bacterium]